MQLYSDSILSYSGNFHIAGIEGQGQYLVLLGMYCALRPWHKLGFVKHDLRSQSINRIHCNVIPLSLICVIIEKGKRDAEGSKEIGDGLYNG